MPTIPDVMPIQSWGRSLYMPTLVSAGPHNIDSNDTGVVKTMSYSCCSTISIQIRSDDDVTVIPRLVSIQQCVSYKDRYYLDQKSR